MIDDFKRPPAPEPARTDFNSWRAQPIRIQPEAESALPRPTNDPADPFAVHPAPAAEPETLPVHSGQPITAGQLAVDDTLELLPEHATPDKKTGLNALLAWRPTKKQAIIIAAAFLVLAGGGTAFALSRKEEKPAAPVAAVKTPAPAPKPIVSPLTGLTVTAEQQARPVTGVMVENSPDARPQSGLDQAGVVFEAIAEAGITRFLALYQETNPGVLGPVRSARPYYLDWAMAFDASYAHVGGSPDALQRIKDISVKDLDQFYNSGAYHRISTRYAPHNVYTSIDSLTAVETAKGWTQSSYASLPRASKEAPAQTPTAASINMAISGPTYNVHYDYDKASNSYKRSEGGAAHVDNETKQQLSPKVVIALATPYSLMSDGYHSQYQTTGSGKMYIFQNGIVTPGTWSKGQPKDQFVFTTDAGDKISLNAGQTWITMVNDIGAVTYQ